VATLVAAGAVTGLVDSLGAPEGMTRMGGRLGPERGPVPRYLTSLSRMQAI
jgi:hypothetical protein